MVGDWSFDENYGSYDGDREVQMIVLTRLQQSKMSRRYRRSLLFHLNFLLKQKKLIQECINPGCGIWGRGKYFICAEKITY